MRILLLIICSLTLSAKLWGQSSYAPLLQGTWDGDWVESSGFLFTFRLDLDTLPDKNIEGKIYWLLVKHPADRLDYKDKIGKRATEFVRGKININKVFLEGYQRQDPHQIISLDKYNLVLDCSKQTLEGESYEGGTWAGRFFALRRASLDTAACHLQEQSIHYCHTLLLNTDAYPSAADRAIYYQWIQSYLDCKGMGLVYFHLAEWSFEMTKDKTQAADTGEKSSDSVGLLALFDFQEAWNRHIFARRMSVARQLISIPFQIKDAALQDDLWLLAEEKSNQLFLTKYPNFRLSLLPLIQQIIKLQCKQNQKPNFWRMLQEELSSTQKLDFQNESMRIKKQRLYLDFLRNP